MSRVSSKTVGAPDPSEGGAAGTLDLSPATLRPTITGTSYAVATGHYLASQAAARILDAGGNAIDAGVAAGLCTNVLLPDMTSLGGVAPIMLHMAALRETWSISGIGTWPRAASVEFFRNHANGKIPLGILRTVVPAAVDAWLTALERFGSMSLGEVAASAIELARNGFPVYPLLAHNLAVAREQLAEWSSSSAVFLPDGRPVAQGDLLVQADLANTLERLVAAERNTPGSRAQRIRAARDLFYRGEIAYEIDQFCRAQGALLSLEDLTGFTVELERPPSTTYASYDVFACGPWSQGPTLLEMLNLVEQLKVSTTGHNTADYIHLLTEIFKLAFADREAYVGDPRFVDVPLTGLTSKGYAAEHARRVDRRRAWPELPSPGNPWSHEGRTGVVGDVRPPVRSAPPQGDTSYFCIVDRWRNVFSATPSDMASTSPLIPGLGFILSSRGGQSWLDDTHPSRIEPGKRPRLTPNPALLTRAGRAVMPFGTPGGDNQCQAMVQVVLNIIDFKMEPQAAVEAPRFATYSMPESFVPHSYRPGVLKIEERVPQHIRADLGARGHEIEVWPNFAPLAGAVCVIQISDDNRMVSAAADPRRMSYAIGW